MFVDLLKTKSFLQFQTAHNKAHTPTRMCRAVSKFIPSSHVPNKVLMEFGGVMLKAMWTDRHKFFAKGQSRKRCLMDSCWSQKLHLVDPVQLRFTKLSFVKITCLCTNHINTLILKGTLTFQTCFDQGITLELITSKYMDLTENSPFLDNFQHNWSGSWDSWTSINLRTRWTKLPNGFPLASS